MQKKQYLCALFRLIQKMNWTKEAKDTVWLIGLQGVNYVVPLFVLPYLMAVLGAEQFGVYSFGIALAQYLMMLVDFGFNLTASKQIALARGNVAETDRLFSATMVSKGLLLALSAIVVMIVGALPAYRIYRTIIWITWLMVVGNTFSMYWLFQGAGKIRLVAVVNTLMKLLILPLTFLLVKSPSDVRIAAWIQVAVFMTTGAVMAGLTWKLGLAHWMRVQWTDIRGQIRSSWSIFLSNAATSTYTALFVVILAYMVSAEEVGKYAAAEKIIRSVCYMIWLPLSQAYFPRISRLGKENPAEGRRLIRMLTLFVMVVLGAAGIGMAVVAEPLTAWIGKDYAGIGGIAAILAVVPLFIGVGGVQGQMGLIALGDEKDKASFRNVYLAAGLISLASVCGLSWYWGATGAAAALVITEGFVCAGMCLLNAKRKQ